MSRTTRRGALAAAGTGVAFALAGCSGLSLGGDSSSGYGLESLELVNAHDEPHEVQALVTADESAEFARSVRLDAADHGGDDVDTTNEQWDRPVEGRDDYHLHVKVDDRDPQTHRYGAGDHGADGAVAAAVWLSREDGELYFDTAE